MPRTSSRRSVFSPEVPEAALAGLEAQRQRIDEQIGQVRSLLGAPRRGRPRKTSVDSAPSVAAQPKRRALSAAARRRMAAAQKKRWAQVRKGKEVAAEATPESAKRTKRHMSAAGRRRIVEANRRRWAEFRKKQGSKK